MQIPVNKNIDEYKDDFFKGLTLRQTAVMAGVLFTAGAGFLLFSVVLHIPSAAALYCAFPVPFAVGAAGLFRVHGMALTEWLQKKKQVTAAPLFSYRPYLMEIQEKAEIPRKKKRGRKETWYLETMEEQFLRMGSLEEKMGGTEKWG